MKCTDTPRKAVNENMSSKENLVNGVRSPCFNSGILPLSQLNSVLIGGFILISMNREKKNIGISANELLEETRHSTEIK